MHAVCLSTGYISVISHLGVLIGGSAHFEFKMLNKTSFKTLVYNTFHLPPKLLDEHTLIIQFESLNPLEMNAQN